MPGPRFGLRTLDATMAAAHAWDERWRQDLCSMLVGKFPYLVHECGTRLIDEGRTPLQRRGNRMLYSAIWQKLTENTAPQAQLFKSQCTAVIGDA